MNINFNEDQFNRLFPFFMIINSEMIIESTGKSLDKIFPNTSSQIFFDNYFVYRPDIIDSSFSSLVSLTDQLVVIQCKNEQKINLRGQIEVFPDESKIIFLGTPWFGSMEQVISNNLTLSDFSFHDPMIDLLLVIKTTEIATNDLKQLLNTLSKQKKELKNAYKEIYDTALFPTENPDPLIRISLSGDLLKTNPAAEGLTNFVYENQTYTMVELFKNVVNKIDTSTERWIFEAISGDKIFSFVCKATKNKEYINIYGRNVTKAKRDQQELERLSLIIHETQNAVIITDPKGKVEWVNNAFYKVTGFTLDEIKGKTPGSVLQGNETNSETVQYMREKIRNAKPFIAEIYNYKKTGEGYWLRINAQPIINEKGKVTAFFAIEEDITFEREAQDKIKAAASRMSTLISNLNAGILLENSDGSISLVNNKFCELFNLDVNPDSLIGDIGSVLSKQNERLFTDSEFFTVRTDEILVRKEFVSGELLELKDGRIFLRDFIPILVDELYKGHLWVYTDITEKKTAEKKLQDQRVFYEKILDNIPADIAVFDTEQRFKYVNPTGISDPESRKWVIGKSEEEFLKRIKRPAESALERRLHFEKVIENKQLETWEEKFPKDNGEFVYSLLNFFPVTDENNNVELVIGYGVDITNIKNIQQQIIQSEKRYRDVIDNGLALISTHDMTGKFLSVNPMVSKVYGYPDDEILGHYIYDFIPDFDEITFNTSYLHKIENEKYFSGLFKVVHKDGHIVHTLFNNYLKEEPGMDPYVICFAVDISERVKAQKELEIAKKKTEELAQAKQNFLANMSHEIRTPMNGIIGMANQLLKTELNSDQSFFLGNIQSAADNLLIIINDILDLSKIEAGKLTIEEIGFEPELIIKRALQVMSHRAEEKGLELKNTYFDSSISPVLMGDPFRLNQILLNLLSNALKFTEKGRVDVRCELINETDLEQTIKLSVEDTGIGMEKEFVKNLFQKFSQEDDSVTRKYGGTGLGMSISSELVDLMGGTIVAESDKGKGTRVSITITLKIGSEDQLPVKETNTVNKSIFRGKQFLVTDDNEMNRLVASTILKSYGGFVIEAVDGKDAIEKVKDQRFDIVLMDVQMPIMNGIDAIKYIRANISQDLPIIAMTAYALKGDEDRFIDAGMNDYLSKPFDEYKFLNLIAHYLGHSDEIVSIAENEEVVIDDDEILYDLSSVKAIAGTNTDFVKQISDIFIKQVQDIMQNLKDSFHENDFERVRNLAHGIKPSIDNMGIKSLHTEIRELEVIEWDMSSKAELGKRIEHIERILNKVCDQLNEL